MDALEYIMANQAQFAVIGASVLALGGAVVKLTPTKKDDAWYEAIMRAVGRRK